jgi:hypothetical protein
MSITTGTFWAAVYGVATCLTLVTFGCAAAMPKSGFLEDYSSFEKIHDDAPAWNFIDPEGVGTTHRTMRIWADVRNLEALKNYDRFMHDTTVVRLGRHSPGNWVSPDKLQQLVDGFSSAFEGELTAYYPKVDAPGAGVIRFRAAITDIWPAFLYESPQEITALQWANSRPGGTSIEAEAVDSVSGERIFALIASGHGSGFDPLTVEDVWENARKVPARFGKFIGEKMKEAHSSD